MISGYFIHEGVLDRLYVATKDFWRPELQQVCFMAGFSGIQSVIGIFLIARKDKLSAG